MLLAELEDANQRVENINAVAPISTTTTIGESFSSSPVTTAMQTKIIPFDELQLAIDELSLSRYKILLLLLLLL